MKTFSFFPYGVQYHRAPTPLPDEWEGDMAELVAAGYTHLQFRPQWRWHEAIRGKPVFDDLDRLFGLAQEYQLRVILKPMLETAPDWVFSELEGTRIGFHGVPLSPIAHGAYYVGGWWPCFDNPAVLKAATGFSQALVQRYRDHPALWLYNAWNEPRSRPLGSCQCLHSQAAYRVWLKQRFATVEDLNDFYGKRWSSFDTIMPPATSADYVEMALWRDWAAEATASHVKAVVHAIRGCDLEHPVMFHRGLMDIVTDIAWDAGDDLRNARVGADWYGLSCAIEFHPKTLQDHALIALQCDWARRVDRNFWVHEFYPRTANWSRSPRIDHLQQQSLMVLAGGARGFTWWQYRSERLGNESNGYGLVEIDGGSTARSEYAAALGKTLETYGTRLAESDVPRGEVALLYHRGSDMISRMAASSNHFSSATENAVYKTAYKQAISGAHALHWLHNIERDFVVPGDPIQSYRMLHVTGMEVMDETVAIWLRSYVMEGGFLLVEFPFACRDDNSWVSPRRPNHGLEDLLGCREALRVNIDGLGDDRVIWPEAGAIPGSGHRCDLLPTTGQVMAIWADGKPAAVLHSYGKGRVLSLGINLSQSYQRGAVVEVETVFREICSLAGVTPTLPSSLAGKVVRQRRIAKDGSIEFLFNLSDSECQIPKEYDKAASWWGTFNKRETSLTLGAGKSWIGLKL